MIIRKSIIQDLLSIQQLYQTVARISGGIARKEHEISEAYIQNFLTKSLANGCSMVAEEDGRIIAEVHTYSFGIECFAHMFGDTTICVHPDFQGKGVGRKVFSALLDYVSNERKDILRVELHARESNAAAIELYKKLGFNVEGRAVGRVLDPDGRIVADVPMGWLNPNFLQ
ncbi:GNAT family N-acetyltransferase [Runella slithyformis]|uniref:GCN5-related N-acetyltransferase n=1 Tax=Runella slithyformis (strain ATCC 29530 / DSM 19594 / LMG 11500 / NCIMB 11436 / LSU 4) TaxID=761193 RepID=A0A7U3ZQT1_RUNSL|nr:GNAT family N-acetyltransferase [Runella slithyformis]AEI51660.1 GCN5-related N-acetyltransferase [Runella slithyformis DSM 19594]